LTKQNTAAYAQIGILSYHHCIFASSSHLTWTVRKDHIMSASWPVRFLTSTRGRLIAILRRESRTVDEMAAELQVTDNAIRAHLAALERDGFVRQCGVRRGGGAGKPAYAYELTASAEQLFPKPYVPVLSSLLSSLDERLTRDEVEALLRDVGRRIAREYPSGAGDAHARLQAATEALNQLGGLATLDARQGSSIICGYDCPLASLVPDHPEVCVLAEAFVSEVAGSPVQECCQRDGTPRCRFALAKQP
jgi:predicted ArsR family transcriptional regulator